jgi:hypothetical protein
METLLACNVLKHKVVEGEEMSDVGADVQRVKQTKAELKARERSQKF